MFTTRQILKFDDVITYGKYKGLKICVIMAKDIGYIRWMVRKGVEFDYKILKCLTSIKE